MSGPHLRVFVQVGDYPSELDKEIIVPLDKSLIVEAFRPIDMPLPSSDAFTRYLCSPTDVVERATTLRKDSARILSESISRAIITAMSSNDLVVGYRKEDI